MTEVHVKFLDYLITFDKIETGTVSYARVASWLMRYPHARITEKLGKSALIIIETLCNVPDDLRFSGD